jgi:hypothetical protein
MARAILVVPTRHGLHWPQLAREKASHPRCDPPDVIMLIEDNGASCAQPQT